MPDDLRLTITFRIADSLDRRALRFWLIRRVIDTFRLAPPGVQTTVRIEPDDT